jgi:hypothetical protein
VAQVYDKIVVRNGTELEWTTSNPILLEGEVGITMDTIPKKFKVGNGTSTWSELPYESKEFDTYTKAEILTLLNNKQDINSYIDGGSF